MTEQIQQLINIMSTSVVLYRLIPYVRRITLIETLRTTENIEQAYNIFLENLSTSPYIPENQKNELADMVFRQDLNSLYSLLRCSQTVNTVDKLSSFREMVLAIFSKSKKIQLISSEKRQFLGASIIHSLSIEGLKQLALTALETSEVFNNEARNLVANDIFDNRFDLLLLPDRFDCEEVNRLNNQDTIEEIPTTPELDECPICLGTSEVDSKLPCQHLFCRSCIQRWANQSLECPLCRRSFSLEDISDI